MSAARPSQDEAAPARYVVGIDLGTTNSALAFVDTEAEPWRIATFPVPQLTAPATVESFDTLPSFHYQPAAAEVGPALRLPWDDAVPEDVVGVWAREQGAAQPGRLAVSAKSWLSHSGVDRTAPLLPWHGDEGTVRYSPGEVSARYLAHLRRAWDAARPEHPLAEQDVVVTVPASFDEIARELTVDAARRAGLPRLVLIEEPQAAFYAWLDRRRQPDVESGAPADEAAPRPGETVLVCDVGGGTTDFTLIRVEERGDGGARFHRVAVGDHLILGGDNLDLALAHHLEDRLGGEERLDPRRWGVLVRRCQQAKERLLGEDPPAAIRITLPGGGARLVGGATSVELTREEAETVLLDGFLPRVDAAARPARHASGFREFGLPYAADSGITRYLAAFLAVHDARPDVVLLNGGFFASPVLRRRLLEVVAGWLGAPPRVLANRRLDLAVAHGAAYYGMVRRGEGERIQAGLAHAYYLGVEAEGVEEEGVEAGAAYEATVAASAVCLVPAGLEEGETVELARDFALRIRQPVELEVYTSSSRTTDAAGDLVTVEPAVLTPLPPIRTVLRSGKKATAEEVTVRLVTRLSEIGTLEVGCVEVGGNRSWRLEFDVRAAVSSDAYRHEGLAEAAGIVDAETVERATAAVAEAFGSRDPAAPQGLTKRLEREVGSGRDDWPPSLLRALWQELERHDPTRRTSVAHEARWLNLLGFSLRPGYGYALDDWRVGRTWRLSHGSVHHRRNEQCQAEWWVLWRRIAGGLSAGQQKALAQPLLSAVRGRYGDGRGKAWKAGDHETAEVMRLLGALERLEVAVKVELGELLAGLVAEDASRLAGAPLWALGRLGSRVLAYGPLDAVVPTTAVESWIERLLSAPSLAGAGTTGWFALMQLARRTGDRYRDVASALRHRLVERLAGAGAPEAWRRLVAEGGELAAEDQRLVFGESLPKGLAVRRAD